MAKEKITRKSLLSRPVESLDLMKTRTTGELVDAFRHASIQARNIGLAAEVYENMLSDSDRPTVILGLSGPLIAAGLRKVIRDLVELGLVDVIVSTGAVLYQDIYQARGYRHYMGSPFADDTVLRDLSIDRIYDTYVDELKFEETDRYVADVIEGLGPGCYSSREVISALSARLNDSGSILYSAYRRGIPVFSPALNDSSIGIGLTLLHFRQRGMKERFILDSIKDNYEIVEVILKSRKTGVIYIGGGTPKNWINDAEVMAGYAFNTDIKGHSYALQITTDSPQWGGLSGSTLEEARSWGKIQKKATTATAYVEASIGLPLIASYVIQKRLFRGRKRARFEWSEDGLKLSYR
ncbi:MAG: deoxyhypusine synthase family protein [Thermoplasmata archaeon YP2-bin.285]|uniref:Deoxyhypusine synthase family protein n=3 Tax=Candidatus Sysuiplasma superficiale TaxID=2823368 RepID=A0A8J7YKS4_9ARCH|nr:deoxyhypusine synthase family protein [Candidatus Sysuiplasma superficiale]